MSKITIVKTSELCKHEYKLDKRFYINSQNPAIGEHIFNQFEVYFSGNIPETIKNATEKGIDNLLKAANIKEKTKITNHNLSYMQMENFLNSIGTSINHNPTILNNILSGYGHQKKAYQILVGNFNLEGLSGSSVGDAVIVNNYNQEYQHEILVSHELGHMFKAAANNKRKNIQNAIGMHCFDNIEKTVNGIKIVEHTPCVMRQDFTNEHMEALSKIGAIYCPDCIKDMKEYISGK